MSNVLVVCRETNGRVPLTSPTGSDVHELLLSARVLSAGKEPFRTVRASRLPDVLAVAEAEGWRVIESRARRAQEGP
ncbi:hypothetical protein [Arsenicicoccus dermatophilus]|uniref:hypothetical protein n=1 Tax=Arsenicicoccus dermatophilus TaxID=1076331 RepID=UPI001F4C98EA|nr:hypothetical protein [Arsenicicoccus dermatophilus]MCH8611783.1 hypothetical protein [Arsenicicoccus dermatophilus]